MMTVLGFVKYALQTIGWDVEMLPATRQLRVTDNHGRKWLLEVKQV